MTPTANEMLTKLASMFPRLPNFRKHWEKYSDGWTDNDDSFTLWSLFSEFSRFVRDHWNEISEQKRKELMNFIESCLVEGHKDDDLDNAVCTCFLENLSGEPPLSRQLREHMEPKSLKFFNEWDFLQSV